MGFPLGCTDVKPEELCRRQTCRYMTLLGTTLAPLSYHLAQPEDAEQALWARMEGGWECYPSGSVTVFDGHSYFLLMHLGGRGC